MSRAPRELPSPVAETAPRPAAGAAVGSHPARIASDWPLVLIVGCGRALRRDDQAGLAVAALLKRWKISGVRVLASQSPGCDLLTELGGVRLLVLVDAACGEALGPVGTCTRIVWRRGGRSAAKRWKIRRIAQAAASSHLLGVADALEVGEALGLLPDDVWVYAIRGEDFGYGSGLSQGLAGRMHDIAGRIATELAAWRAREGRDDA